jgi:hypothetical protein
MKAVLKSPQLSLTLPYYIDFTLRRPEEEGGKSIVFRWGSYSNALAHGQLVLLHITPNGPERIDVPPLSYAKPDPDTIEVNGWNQFLWELKPGGEIEMQEKLTPNYQRLLQPGQRYELVWPGAKVPMWDWGSMAEHVGKGLHVSQHRSQGAKLPQLMLPTSTSVIAFTAIQAPEPCPSRLRDDTDADFQKANMAEANWRREEERKRNLPASPESRSAEERV